ncbi:MAG: hypothetical protein KKH98_09405 [Spirochaetes bacterium]|nr:hypothetical protein [Spirochaetota bacterium]
MSNKDKLENKLGLDRLNEKEKKKLFNKFVEGGGQIVDDKKNKNIAFDRNKQKEWVDKLGKHKSRKKDWSYEDDLFLEENDAVRVKKKVKLKTRIILYIKGVYHRTITLGGIRVNDDFFKFVKLKFIPGLKNLDSIMNSIFSSGEENMDRIKTELEKKSPYYYALLIKYNEFYNDDEYNSLLYFYNKSSFNKITPQHLEEPLKNIFRKIYILRGFISGSFTSLRTALFITAKNKGWDRLIYQKKLNQIKYTVNMIFYHLLPKLYSLVLLINQENIPLKSKKMVDYLSIKDSDKVDYYTSKGSSFQSTLPRITPIIKKEEKEEGVQYVNKFFHQLSENDLNNMGFDELTLKGMKLMKEIEVKRICEDQKEIMPLSTCSEEDKVLHIFAYFKEFEKEYSFILTSFKIIIVPQFEDNKRIDYKAKMNDLYTPITSLNDRMRDYFLTIKSIDDMNNDKLMHQYDKYNRITALEGKSVKQSFELKKSILEYFGQLKQYFDKFIDDFNNKRSIIENPEDELNFEKEVEGEKKVEKKTVIEAIIDADAFISAFIYRLEEGGDLSDIKGEIVPFEVPQIEVHDIPEETDQKETSFLDEIEETLKDT